MSGGAGAADEFAVEPFRAVRRRLVVVRRIDQPTLVLGSTQPAAVVDQARASAAGVRVARRRGGGGAVLLRPGDPLWLDVWVPSADPLFTDDVVVASEWVGEWWASALSALGAPPGSAAVHRGRPAPSRWSSLVCFAGTGPGEVSVGGRKVVGVSQWRGRQGALFHCAAYRRWRPDELDGLFSLDGGTGAEMRRALAGAAAGVADLALGPGDDPALHSPPLLDRLLDRLLERLPEQASWRVDDGAPSGAA